MFSTGDFQFFSRIFPLDSTIFVTAYRNNAYTPKHAIRSDDPFSKCNILVPFFPRYFAIFLPFFPSNVFRLAMQRYRGNFYNISKSDTVPKFNFFRRSFVFLSSLKDFPLDWIHSSRCTVTRNKCLYNFEMGVSDSEKEGNRVSLPAGGNDVYRRMGREFRKWKLGVV